MAPTRIICGWRDQDPRPMPGWRRGEAKTMFIQTEATPNPATLKFIPGKHRAGRQARRISARAARPTASPLATRLFEIDGVARRFPRLRFHLGHQGRRRVAAPEADGPRRDHGALHVGRAGRRGRRMPTTAAGHTYDPADEETVATIKELLETRVRPAVAQDGGDITFSGFRDGVVYLHMRGACSGCPSSTATLRHGIENLLQALLPGSAGSSGRRRGADRRQRAY